MALTLALGRVSLVALLYAAAAIALAFQLAGVRGQNVAALGELSRPSVRPEGTSEIVSLEAASGPEESPREGPSRQSVNQELADREAEKVRTAADCADWAVAVVTSPGHPRKDAWRPTVKSFSGSAFNFDLFSDGKEPSSKWCEALTADEVSSGGAESRFIEASDSSAAWAVYFWKLYGHNYNLTAEAGNALQDGAQRCVEEKGISPSNQRKLVTCVSALEIDAPSSRLAAVIGLNSDAAASLALNVPDKMPLVVKSLTFASKGKSEAVTLLALPQ